MASSTAPEQKTSPVSSFLSGLLGDLDVSSTIIVEDNAKSSGMRRQSCHRLPCQRHCEVPFHSECRWSSNTRNTFTERRNRLRNPMQQFREEGVVPVEGQRKLPTPSLGAGTPLRAEIQALTLKREDGLGSPTSPRLPRRRASFEEDEVAKFTALRALSFDEDKVQHDTESNNNNAKHQRSFITVDPNPPCQPVRRASDQPSSTMDKKLDVTLNKARNHYSWSDRYCTLKNSSAVAFQQTINSRPGCGSDEESYKQSSQRIVYQIDRILRELDFSGHSSSIHSESSSVDLILAPPVRRKSWADEAEGEEIRLAQ